MSRLLRPTVLLLAAAWLLAAVTPVQAEEEQARLSLAPLDYDGAWFDLELEPGERADLGLRLANPGDVRVEARTYAADVYTMINGGMGVGLLDEPATSEIADWIDYPAANPALAPGDAIERELTVTVPPDAAAGQYIAAVVLERDQAGHDEGDGLQIERVSRQAIAVSIEVPGPAAADLTIGETAHDTVGERSRLQTEVDNPGNRHLVPEGTMDLRGPDGQRAMVRDVDLALVYAGTDTHLEVVLDDVLPPGTYTVTTTLSDEPHDVEATATTTFEVLAPPSESRVPGVDRLTEAAGGLDAWLLLAALGVTLLLVGLGLWARARRRRTGNAQPVPTMPPPPSSAPAPVAPSVPPPPPSSAPAPVAPSVPPPPPAPSPRAAPEAQPLTATAHTGMAAFAPPASGSPAPALDVWAEAFEEHVPEATEPPHAQSADAPDIIEPPLAQPADAPEATEPPHEQPAAVPSHSGPHDSASTRPSLDTALFTARGSETRRRRRR